MNSLTWPDQFTHQLLINVLNIDKRLVRKLVRPCETTHIAQNLYRRNIDRLASFGNLTGEILMDSLLNNLYLLCN